MNWVRTAAVSHPTTYGEEPTVSPGSSYVDIDKVGSISVSRLMKSGNTIPAVPERWLIRVDSGSTSVHLNGLYNTKDEAVDAIDGLVGGTDLTGTFEE